MQKKKFKIEGMHCASCVGKIEKVLSKVKGVKNSSVNFATENATIEFDDTVVSESEFEKVVKSVGYELIVDKEEKNTMTEKNIKSVSIQVVGMGSPHCAMIVDKAIKTLEGIQNTDVDFSNKG